VWAFFPRQARPVTLGLQVRRGAWNCDLAGAHLSRGGLGVGILGRDAGHTSEGILSEHTGVQVRENPRGCGNAQLRWHFRG
jgi:hypothetical protein